MNAVIKKSFEEYKLCVRKRKSDILASLRNGDASWKRQSEWEQGDLNNRVTRTTKKHFLARIFQGFE